MKTIKLFISVAMLCVLALMSSSCDKSESSSSDLKGVWEYAAGTDFFFNGETIHSISEYFDGPISLEFLNDSDGVMTFMYTVWRPTFHYSLANNEFNIYPELGPELFAKKISKDELVLIVGREKIYDNSFEYYDFYTKYKGVDILTDHDYSPHYCYFVNGAYYECYNDIDGSTLFYDSFQLHFKKKK